MGVAPRPVVGHRGPDLGQQRRRVHRARRNRHRRQHRRRGLLGEVQRRVWDGCGQQQVAQQASLGIEVALAPDTGEHGLLDAQVVPQTILVGDADRHFAFAQGLIEDVDHRHRQPQQLDRRRQRIAHAFNKADQHVACCRHVGGVGVLRYLRHRKGRDVARDRHVAEAVAFIGLGAGTDRAGGNDGYREVLHGSPFAREVGRNREVQ